MHVVVVVGPRRAGKGAVAEMLADLLGACHDVAAFAVKQYEFSEIIGALLDSMGLPRKRRNYADLSEFMKEHGGREIFSKRMVEILHRDEHAVDVAIVSGARYDENIQEIKKHFRVIVVGVDAPPELRFARCTPEKDGEGLTLDQFLADESAETEREVPRLVATADYIIFNDGRWCDLGERTAEVAHKIDTVLWA